MATPMPETAPVLAEAYNPAPPPARTYVGAEVLQWFVKRDATQPLLLLAPQQGPPPGNGFGVGTTGDPNMTEVFPGKHGLDYGVFTGMRISAGTTFGDSPWGFEGSIFALERRQDQGAFTGVAGKPFITQPFLEINQFGVPVQPAALLVSSAPTATQTGLNGSIFLDAHTQFWGWELNATYRPDESAGKVSMLHFGFRQLNLNEALNMSLTLSPATSMGPGNAMIGFNGAPIFRTEDQIHTVDSFTATNQFNGPQIGATFTWGTGPLTFDFTPKIAVGANHETVVIRGNTTLLHQGAIAGFANGGVFALPSNIGIFERDELTVVPELTAKLSLELTSWARVNVGYNLLYLSSVVRPGTQVDPRLDFTQMPSDVAFGPLTPPLFPRPWFRDTDFYAHGFTAGLELRW